MAREKSEFVSAAGTVFEIVKGLSDEVRTLGGSDDALRRLLAEQPLRRQVAELLVVKQVGDKYVVTVNYGKQLKTLIAAGGYDWVNDYYEGLTWGDWKEPDGETPAQFPSRGKVETEVVLVHLDRYAETSEVLAELESRGLRPANVAELVSFGIDHPEVQREFPVVELGSIWVGPDGHRYVAYLWSRSDRRYLDLRWYDGQWPPLDRFLAVSN